MFKKFIRNNFVKRIIKILPSYLILLFIKNLQRVSIIEKKIKTKLTQSYDLDYVNFLLDKYGVDYIISGHLHKIILKNINGKMLVSCGAWGDDKGEFVIYDGNNFKAEIFIINNEV